jgi:SH3-like domain-containing protein
MPHRKFLTVAALILGAATCFSQQWALARLSVVAMRAQPRHAAEMVSQALMGHPVKVVERGDDWSRVETADGYLGYIINHSLAFKSDAEMAQWRASRRVVATSPYEFHLTDSVGVPVSDVVAGCILTCRDDSTLVLPDGRTASFTEGFSDFDAWANADFDAARLPQCAAQYMGVPYLWGGLSSKGMDCSGLVRMAYLAQGRLLPRDAWQQALEGAEVTSTDSLRVGDLLFFGNKSTGRITHVAIFADPADGSYVHSSQMVRRNSISRQSALYLPFNLLTMRRVSGTRIAEHPWY